MPLAQGQNDAETSSRLIILGTGLRLSHLSAFQPFSLARNFLGIVGVPPVGLTSYGQEGSNGSNCSGHPSGNAYAVRHNGCVIGESPLQARDPVP